MHKLTRDIDLQIDADHRLQVVPAPGGSTFTFLATLHVNVHMPLREYKDASKKDFEVKGYTRAVREETFTTGDLPNFLKRKKHYLKKWHPLWSDAEIKHFMDKVVLDWDGTAKVIDVPLETPAPPVSDLILL